MKDPNWRKCVLRADSRDIIKRIPDNSIDFILTDPPYNLGQHSTGNIPLPGRSAMNNDVAEWDMIDFNPEEWADEFIRILKPTGNRRRIWQKYDRRSCKFPFFFCFGCEKVVEI